MKRISRLVASVIVVGALTSSATTVFASPGLCYYHFGPGFGSGGFTTPIDSPTFTVTNTSNVVTIDGWQDSYTNAAPANVDYTIYQSYWLGDINKGLKNMKQNYPQNGSWYNYTFTNITYGLKYYIRMTPHNSAGMSGAGNAYDGY